MTATLKKLMGEAGAGLDDSTGQDNLYDVLKALAEGAGEVLTVQQATIATATLAGLIAKVANRLGSLDINVATCGTADTTTVVVNVNGADVSDGGLSIAHDEDDGTSKSLALDVALDAEDLVEIEVTAAPGTASGAGLTATVRLLPVTVE